ncbi:MAG: hypothetical protein ACE5G2_03330 [Candidatus Krumholzibacteriia bacterium]
MTLAKELFPEDARILARIQALLRRAPRIREVLQPKTADQLRRVAADLEESGRRGMALLVLVQKIDRSPENGVQLKRSHAVGLADLLKKALTEDVQTRVHELRARLASLPSDEEGLVMTVTRAPYRFIRVPCQLSEMDERAVRAIYPLFDRPAWLTRIGYIEAKGFKDAQDRYRFALATGVPTTDNGIPLKDVDGVPKRFLGTQIRCRLDWASEVSHMLQDVFELFYEPNNAAPDPQRTYVLGKWAKPQAVDIIRFLNGGRNEILRIMNPFFRSLGLEPYPLIQGVAFFPPRWVEAGSIPDHPQLMRQDELRATYRMLRGIGVKHLLPECATA